MSTSKENTYVLFVWHLFYKKNMDYRINLKVLKTEMLDFSIVNNAILSLRVSLTTDFILDRVSSWTLVFFIRSTLRFTGFKYSDFCKEREIQKRESIGEWSEFQPVCPEILNTPLIFFIVCVTKFLIFQNLSLKLYRQLVYANVIAYIYFLSPTVPLARAWF